MFFRNQVSRNYAELNNSDVKEDLLCTIYNSIKNLFPQEVCFDEAAGLIDYRRETEKHLTIFTITLNGGNLSFSYNDCGLLAVSDISVPPDKKILKSIKKIIKRSGYFPTLEFYEAHDNITWKHEIYKC